ncbi:MAG: glycoside hydrolase family 32 protein [Lapillicoccus sp.]
MTRYHVAPRRGWLNDPNGMVHHAGRWHVFFQHNPDEARHGNIAWGHVSSVDLVTWLEHPVAFRPQPCGPDRGGCWSGVSVVVGDRVAAAYTGIETGPTGSTICVRYAADAPLDDWSAPLVAGREPEGLGITEMRDPFVFSWSGRRWALLGAGLADGPALLLWSCDDLDTWRFEQVWLTPSDPVLRALGDADIWECPQLVEVDGSWVLVVSLWKAGTLDRAVYAVGSLVDDGGRPRFVARGAGVVDAGTVCYAPQVLSDAPGGGPLLLGWAREDDPVDAPAPDAVAGCLTLPRRLRLDGDRLVSDLDPAVRRLVGDPIALSGNEAQVPAQAYLRVDAPVRLTGLATTIAVDAGSEVWVDDDVVEVYPQSGTPETYRDPGTTCWRLVPTTSAAANEVASHA